jgi:hypothetical protein
MSPLSVTEAPLLLDADARSTPILDAPPSLA